MFINTSSDENKNIISASMHAWEAFDEENKNNFLHLSSEISKLFNIQISLAFALQLWASAVKSCESCFSSSVFTYINALEMRDYIEVAVDDSKNEPNLKKLVDSWDSRFKKSSFSLANPLMSKNNAKWWWHRYPTRVSEDMLNDSITHSIIHNSKKTIERIEICACE